LAAFALAVLPVPARGSGLLIADGGLGGVLEIKEHSVKVTINNGIAVTEVTQVFRNTENRQVEALYTFPVPRSASVANFSMWINGKEMTGEVVEKKRAREIYESYKTVRRDPGLLEQVDYRTFEMRIFPIAPNAEQRVQIAYYQELEFDHDQATYVYPLASTTRKGVDARTTGKFALTLDVKSEVPIAEMGSPSHPKDFAIARHTAEYQQASLETRGGDLSRDVVLNFKVARPRTGLDIVTSRQGGDDGYFLMTLTAGQELANAKNPAMDYVFVLDVSGSMNDDGKLGTSRRSIEAFVDSLSGEDRFEILTFNVAANSFFKQLTPATDEARKRAAEFLNSQQARGGTVLNPAVTTAYKYAEAGRTLNVVILSDGLTEQSERASLVQLIRSRPKDSRVFCIGVGNDVNRPLLEQLAHDSGGLAAFLSNGDDFDRQAKAFRRKLMHPMASDVKVAMAGAEGAAVTVYDLEPLDGKLPNLYHGAPLRLYGRYKGSGQATVKISASINGQPWEQSVPVALPEKDDANPQIERMWAMKKVDRLLKEADAAGSRTGVADEIVRLGEAYSIVSEYTSFIVLENNGEYQRWAIQRRNALRIQRDRAAQQTLASQLEALRTKATADLGPVSAASGDSIDAGEQKANAPRLADPASGGQRGRDLSIPLGGGGALDPISVSIVLAGGAVALVFRRRRID
jgi:Ca-activated chloride channel family protein